MTKAYYVRDVSENFTGVAQVFKVDPPMRGDEEGVYPYVVVSATYAMSTGPETYIFGYNIEKDTVANWLELEGSFQGEENIAKALANAGYEIKE